jgi:triphosphoribosyl-dephospho-CoA synthase
MNRPDASAATVDEFGGEQRAEQFRAAFITACDLDVAVRKPGNVSHASPGHGMTAALFEASARAAAGPLTQVGAPVGKRIEAAMRATLAAAGCNTNLGIVLLAAPLARAWELRRDAQPLRMALADVLQALDIDDAAAAFRAIALTQPAGLGRVDEHDVASAPKVTLLQAMAAAAGRDRIAALYVDAGTAAEPCPYAELFDIGLTAWQAALAKPPGRSTTTSASTSTSAPANTACNTPGSTGNSAARHHALQRVYLELLCTAPDTHIVRKHGPQPAQSVMRAAEHWLQQACKPVALDADPAWAAWDEALKQARINPGTCADLSVGTALLALLRAPE